MAAQDGSSFASASRAASCSASFFERPLPTPSLLAVDHGGARERPLVRRPVDLEHRVRHLTARAARAPPGARSCGRRSVVSAYSMRPAKAATIASSICSKPCSRKSAPSAASSSAASTLRFSARPLELFLRHGLRACSSHALAEAELARDDRAALARDDVRADLRQLTLGEVRVALVELPRDRELEDAVAEELEPLVRRRAVGRPRRVREDVLQPLGRELVDQRRARGLSALTGARDVVDGLADGLDLLGVLVGDLDPELILELHDQLDEVERVRVEVFLERSLLVDVALLDSELLGQDLLDPFEDFLARSCHITSLGDSGSQSAPMLTRSSPSRSASRSTTSCSTPRAASRIAFAIASETSFRARSRPARAGRGGRRRRTCRGRGARGAGAPPA